MPDLTETLTPFVEKALRAGFTRSGVQIRPLAEVSANVAAVVAAEIRSLIPSVAFKAEGRTDTEAFREAAAKLDAGFAPGGGNMTYAVSRLCREAASVLEGCTADELAARAQRGWARPQEAGRG